MKLDHDVVRNLLLKLETEQKLNEPYILNSSNSTDSELYAAIKLEEAGLIEADIHRYYDRKTVIFIRSMTFDGHTFLDNIRPENSWEKTKSLLKNLGGASLGMAADIAAKVTAELLEKQLHN